MTYPMSSLVSICIPTYCRPALLREAIESALAQTYAHIEVVVCDDSPDGTSERLVASFQKPIRYMRNRPAQGQAGNVNRLFDSARGDRLVLLHDDDRLLPTAIEELVRCWDAHAGLIASFGKQQIIAMQGIVLESETIALNSAYHRTPERAGRQQSAIESALVGQFPNDGYLVATEIARMVRYRDTPDVAEACDFDFGLRLASHGDFYFVNSYTAQYRLTDTSISTGTNSSHLTYALIANAAIPSSLDGVRMARLRTYAPRAVTSLVRLGERQRARRIFLSPHYATAARITPYGLFHLAALVLPRRIVHATMRWWDDRKALRRRAA